MSSSVTRLMETPNTHGERIPFGKHKGELFTRLPLSYLKWMLNESSLDFQWKRLARAEFDRRGDTMPKVELSGHAIDNASLRVKHLWEKGGGRLGLYSWLQRMVLDAMEYGEKDEDGTTYRYKGMKLVIVSGEEYPSLLTIMLDKKATHGQKVSETRFR